MCRLRSAFRLWTATGALVATVLCATGCPEKREKPEPREMVGTIEEIDLANSRVKVQSYIEKHEQYDTFTVLVTEDTEILINGSLATLSDVRVGERAEGTIEVVRREGRTVLTAQAVNIERGEVLSAPGASEGGASAAAEPPDMDGDSNGAPPPGSSD